MPTATKMCPNFQWRRLQILLMRNINVVKYVPKSITGSSQIPASSESGFSLIIYIYTRF
jgi:hypothetical protein